MSEKAFRIGPIRPPSEANSLLIQVTNGCTWNKCRVCQLYRHTKFKAYSADSIRADIDNIAYWAERVRKYERKGTSAFAWDIEGINAELSNMTDADDRQCMYTVANWLISGGENVFLQDGNSTALSGGRLSDVLIYLRQVFPQIKRITSYGRAENLSRSSAEEFAELKAAGLDRIHSGFETGSNAVLQRIDKGVTQEQQIRAGRAIKEGGIELSIYFMPGVGGKDLSEANAEGTAEVINAVNPDFVRVRTAAMRRYLARSGARVKTRSGRGGSLGAFFGVKAKTGRVMKRAKNRRVQCGLFFIMYIQAGSSPKIAKFLF